MYIFQWSVFGIQISPTWYWLMYALGFTICYLWMLRFAHISREKLDTLLVYVFFWVILGGRFWYVILYDFSYFFDHPYEIFAIWKWGMSFHGGFLGTLIAIFLFQKRHHVWFFDITDPLAIIIPVALGLGRIGNYINQELPGYSPYSWPLAMMINGTTHFPSPLLEMTLEWVLLFIVMIMGARHIGYFGTGKGRNPANTKILSWIFLIGYSFARLIAEFFRLPDRHIGYLFSTDWMTLGMIYTLPIFLLWIYLLTLRWEGVVFQAGWAR